MAHRFNAADFRKASEVVSRSLDDSAGDDNPSRVARNVVWSLVHAGFVITTPDEVASSGAPENAEGAQVNIVGWIAWVGGKCPVSHDTLVLCRLRDGEEFVDEQHAGDLRWRHTDTQDDIIAYRIIQESDA